MLHRSSFFRNRIPYLLRSIFPQECPLCEGMPFDGTANMLCKDCLMKMPFLRGTLCPGCGGEMSGILALCPECMAMPARPWNRAIAVFRMEGLLREIIHDYKYNKQPELAKMLSDFAIRRLRAEFGDIAAIPQKPFDAVTALPLHWTRRFERGFNQAELLAEEISQQCGIPLIHALKRCKRTRQQAKLSRKQRILNLNNAFCIIHSTKVKKRAILLVDDVMTTGSTLSAASAELLRGGASAVTVLVIARRQRN